MWGLLAGVEITHISLQRGCLADPGCAPLSAPKIGRGGGLRGWPGGSNFAFWIILIKVYLDAEELF
jgi:hypothetical protein